MRPSLIADDLCVAPTVMAGLGPATQFSSPTHIWEDDAYEEDVDGQDALRHDSGNDVSLSTGVGMRPDAGGYAVAVAMC